MRNQWVRGVGERESFSTDRTLGWWPWGKWQLSETLGRWSLGEERQEIRLRERGSGPVLKDLETLWRFRLPWGQWGVTERFLAVDLTVKCVFGTVYCGSLETGCGGSHPGDRELSRRLVMVLVVSQALNDGGLDQGHGGRDWARESDKKEIQVLGPQHRWAVGMKEGAESRTVGCLRRWWCWPSKHRGAGFGKEIVIALWFCAGVWQSSCRLALNRAWGTYHSPLAQQSFIVVRNYMPLIHHVFYRKFRTSVVVQGLRLHFPNAVGPDSVPG